MTLLSRYIVVEYLRDYSYTSYITRPDNRHYKNFPTVFTFQKQIQLIFAHHRTNDHQARCEYEYE